MSAKNRRGSHSKKRIKRQEQEIVGEKSCGNEAQWNRQGEEIVPQIDSHMRLASHQKPVWMILRWIKVAKTQVAGHLTSPEYAMMSLAI